MSTKIEWTKNADGSAGKTWNPISGCSRKSTGCENCYAEVMTKRLAAMGQDKYTGLLNEHGRFNGTIKFDEKALLIPLKTKKPTTWFVNSMSDLFHENVKDEWIDKVFAVMALCPQHTFQILTKRADRMRDYLVSKVGLETREETIMREAQFIGGIIWDSRGNHKHLYQNPKGVENRRSWQGFPLPNVWLGVSVENQKAADERIPLLLDTPAAIRFLSCEPLLEKLDLSNHLQCESCIHRSVHWCVDPVIDWVIVGGESGHGARPCDIAWIRSIVEQCKAAAVPCFVKQLGSVTHWNDGFWSKNKDKGADFTRFDAEFPAVYRVREMPKI